jgi:long-chain acyl-CoA synthetase
MSRLKEMIEGVLKLDPSAPAVEFNKAWLTWGRLAADARALDAALSNAGLGQGTRVGALLRNRPGFVSLLIALLTTDRCLASLNAVSPDDKLAADILKADTPVIVAVSEDWTRPQVRDAVRRNGCLGLELTGDAADPVRVVPGLQGERSRSWAPAPGVAIEMLSSGTTGTPKRIPLTARNLEKALIGAAAFEKGRKADDPPRLRGGVQVVTAPVAHIAGVTGVMNNVLAGRKICLIEKFSVDAFRDAVVRHRPKVAGAPPSAIRMILDADVPREDLSSLLAFRTGTAPLDAELADAFYQRYGIPVLQNYGATEFAGGVAGWTLDDFKNHWAGKRGSVGRLNPGVEARAVAPEDGTPLANGQEGLLEIRAPNIGDGTTWVRTTDISVIDDDRFLWIKGRHDNAIIRGGFKIMPDDVARAMEQHPAVREAGVTALPDRRLGQVPAGAYIAKAGMTAPTEDEFKAFLRDHLLPYQIPVRIKRVDEFPRTPSMKISQPALRSLFESDFPEAGMT